MTTQTVTRDQITALDLNRDMDALDKEGVAYECVLATIDDKAEKAQVLYIPSVSRAGIAWGADAQWTDAGSIEDAIERYVNDEMVN